MTNGHRYGGPQHSNGNGPIIPGVIVGWLLAACIVVVALALFGCEPETTGRVQDRSITSDGTEVYYRVKVDGEWIYVTEKQWTRCTSTALYPRCAQEGAGR